MIYLSIIVPVRNEETFIAATLEMLATQDYPKDRFEIIVVDGRSEDKTTEVVMEYIQNHRTVNICLLHNPGRLSSRARNIGIRNAKGQLIAVVDGHVYIPNDQLFTSMEHLKEENHALCLARPAPLDVPGLKEGTAYWIAVARKTWLGHSRHSYIYSKYEGFLNPISSGFAYDRTVFGRVGHFDESFDAAEDVEFHFRLQQAGILAYSSHRFLIYSYPRNSLISLFRQQVRYGVGRARLVRKHIKGFTLETPIPSLILLFLLALPMALLSVTRGYFISILHLSLTLAYILILLSAGVNEALTCKKPMPVVSIALAVLVTHVGLGWGFLKTMLSPTTDEGAFLGPL
jgi:succinoglycan biosynthesis protein ExoA